MTSKKQIEEVWEKGHSIRGKNPDTWRRDDERKVIRKASYGTLGEYGWEIDHINPASRGGTDSTRNLRPLHWKENREKGNKV